MNYAAMRTLPHPDLMRELVTKVAWGIAAESAAASSLIALPHAANFGAGAAYLHWSPGIVIEAGTAAKWRAVERGAALSGAITVHSPTDIDGDYPAGAAAPVAVGRSSLIISGEQARFQMVASLETHIEEQLKVANRLVARELEGRLGDEAENWAPSGSNHGVVDTTALEGIATELMWGAADKPDSTVLRMVDRAATTHINNQPLGSWFAVNLRSRCEEAVRRHIGDPHVGRKIRRLAREHSPSTIEELLDLYGRAHPSESVGEKRVIAALSADKTLDALSHSLSLLTNIPRTENDGDDGDGDVEVSDEVEHAR